MSELRQCPLLQARVVAKVVEKAAIGEAEILNALAQIGFSDIRKIVRWHGNLTEITANEEGGDVTVIKRIVNNHVELIDSDKIDEPTAMAISEISMSPSGPKIKLHPKLPAIMGMAEILGLTAKKAATTPPGDLNVEEMSILEIGRRIAFALDAARREREESTKLVTGSHKREAV